MGGGGVAAQIWGGGEGGSGPNLGVEVAAQISRIGDGCSGASLESSVHGPFTVRSRVARFCPFTFRSYVAYDPFRFLSRSIYVLLSGANARWLGFE